MLSPLASAQQSIKPEEAEFFERQVRPLLLESCVGCHSQAVNKVKGGLNMDSRQSMIDGGESGAAINLQSPDKSLILEAVRRESIEMPPDKPLSSQQIAIIEKWVKMGVPWPESKPDAAGGENWVARRASEHWAWHPIKQVQVPNTETSTTANAIDAFINQTLSEQKITASSQAQRHELIRRLYFDLIGLPPTPQQLEEALGSGADSDQQLIDRLLSSPEYGVRWGRHWLDLVRYAETLGHEFDYPIRHAWRYREAVVNAFNDDIPYDKFIADHIAGDLQNVPRINPQTGVNESLALTAWWWMGDSVHAPVDVKNDWATRLENQVDVFSKTFLGMTVACARCHDHKFDPIGVSDYYGMVGVAKSIRRRFAITDPHDRIANHRELLKAQLNQANSQAQQAYTAVSNESVQRWLDQQIESWRSLSADQLQQQLPIGSPLFALRLLVEQSPTDKDPNMHFMERLNQLRKEAARAEADFNKWQSESQQLADFSQGLPNGWRLEAIKSNDFTKPQGAESSAAKLDWFDGAVPLPSRTDAFASDRFGRSQFMTLRSPNFTLSNRCVCFKMRGKSTQSMVCVDGYFMVEVQGLLFADARKPIDQPNDWGWVVHAGDLNKYIGDPTFLSLEAESGAWFQISEVRLADRGPPANPSSTALRMLNSSADSRQAFRAIVTEYLAQAIRTAVSAEATANKVTTIASASELDAKGQSEQVELARAMLLRSPELLLGEQHALLNDLSQQVGSLANQTPQPVVLIAAEEGDPHDAAIELRGNPHRLGDTTPRGCFQSLTPWSSVAADSSGRLELVKSLTNPEHPLVARVIVNRVWHHLMGRGIAASTDNLGVLGSRPTHPELLDYLAAQFVQHNWSIKWLIRQIVSSNVYRRSSTPLDEHSTSDPDGSLYSHRLVRRLDAEVLRDAMLATCESLDSQITGPSVPIYLTDQMTGRGRPGQSGPLDGNNRRSAFIEVRRNFLHPFLLAFDFPMPSTTTGKRNVSNVPAQALGLLNDPLVDELAKRWVARTSSIAELNQRVSQMIQTAFSRPAKQSEIQRCVDFVNQSPSDGWLDLAHTLINAKEFWYLK
ncbi:MAG: DUF1553 domain-containing protein [Pirellulales bacterium]